MEKNIASHDLSDMMVYEGMHAQSLRFHFKQKFASVKRMLEKGYKALEHVGKFTKNLWKTPQRSLGQRQMGLGTTAAAAYAIIVASAMITFFWLSLLLTV